MIRQPCTGQADAVNLVPGRQPCSPGFVPPTCVRTKARGKGGAARLLLLDGLEDFDDALLVVHYVDALEHLAVLAAAHLAHHLVVVLAPARRPSPASGTAHTLRCLTGRTASWLPWLLRPAELRLARARRRRRVYHTYHADLTVFRCCETRRLSAPGGPGQGAAQLQASWLLRASRRRPWHAADALPASTAPPRKGQALAQCAKETSVRDAAGALSVHWPGVPIHSDELGDGIAG